MPIVITTPVDQVPSTDSTGPDGLLRAQVIPQYAGVFLTVDYSSLLTDPAYNWANPFKATVYRRKSGGPVEIVRGGDQRTQYGGIFFVYDDEVEFGTVYTYWAEAFDATDKVIKKSFSASVITWAPTGGYEIPGVWFKSVDDPALSQPVRVMNWDDGTFATKSSTADVMGSKYPAYNMGTRQGFATQIEVLTRSPEEFDELLEVISYGVLYVVGLNQKHSRRTGYYVAGDAGPKRLHRVENPFYNWTIPLVEVQRPPTAGQNGPVFPWRTLKDRLEEFPTLGDVTAAGKLYRDGAESF